MTVTSLSCSPPFVVKERARVRADTRTFLLNIQIFFAGVFQRNSNSDAHFLLLLFISSLLSLCVYLYFVPVFLFNSSSGVLVCLFFSSLFSFSSYFIVQFVSSRNNRIFGHKNKTADVECGIFFGAYVYECERERKKRQRDVNKKMVFKIQTMTEMKIRQNNRR